MDRRTHLEPTSNIGSDARPTDRAWSEERADGRADRDEPSRGTETATPLDVEGFLTAASEERVWQAQVAAENPTDHPVTAEFAATIAPTGSGDDIGSAPVERTVGPGERDRFRVDVVDPATLSFETVTAVAFEGFRLRIAVDGEPVPEIAPEDADDRLRLTPTADGCAYPFGLDRTHVEVEYEGDWDGVVGVDEAQQTVSRGSVDFGSPDGHATSYVRVDDDARTVTANAQKRDGGDDPLTIRIVHRGEVVAQRRTVSGFGVAVVGANL